MITGRMNNFEYEQNHNNVQVCDDHGNDEYFQIFRSSEIHVRRNKRRFNDLIMEQSLLPQKICLVMSCTTK